MKVEILSPEKKPSLLFSVRFLLAILGFLLTAIQYMQRINMSVAIVCMINNTRLEETIRIERNLTRPIHLNLNQSDTFAQCGSQTHKNATKIDGPFDWNKQIQGFVLSSFFYGYLFTQIAGAWLAIKFGPKIVLELSILIGSIFTLLTPLAARYSYMALIACRFIIGLVHGVVWPAIGSLWPYWAPPAERSTILGFSNAGSQIGNVITLPLGGYLCTNGFDGGWPSIFYVIGIIGIIWCVLWFMLVTNTPAKHRLISHKEKAYILEETKDAVLSNQDKNKKKTPWVGIFTTKAFYALIITHSCSNFGTYLFLTQLPSYMSEVLKFDIKSNGTLSAVPYLSFWLFTILSGIMSDKIIQRKKLSRTAVRKLFNTVGFLVPMGAVIGLIFVTCTNAYVGVALVTVGLAFSGLTYGSGFLVNYNDIGGKFSGMAFGISNTIGTISGIISPYLVGILTTNKKQEEWQVVFLITAAVYLVGALSFLIFGTAETQKWALSSNDSAKEIELNEELAPLK